MWSTGIFLSIYLYLFNRYLSALGQTLWRVLGHSKPNKGIAVLEFLVGGAPELRLPAPVLRPALLLSSTEQLSQLGRREFLTDLELGEAHRAYDPHPHP